MKTGGIMKKHYDILKLIIILIIFYGTPSLFLQNKKLVGNSDVHHVQARIQTITKTVFMAANKDNVYRNLFWIEAIVSVCLLSILIFLTRELDKQKKSSLRANKKLRKFNEIVETIINTNTGFMYLKDKDLKYIFLNDSLREFLDYPYEQIIGKDDFSILDPELAKMCEKTDRDVLKQHRLITIITSWNNRFYRTTKLPVRMSDGTYGVGASVSDVTDEYIKNRVKERTVKHNKLLLEALSRSFKSTQEQLDYALHDLLELSGSQYGYIYLYNEEKEEFVLNSWSRGVMADCTVERKLKVYQLDKTGIWGEVVRQRRPIIINDFEKQNPLKKGYPKGHVELKKFMSVPVFIDDKIVAVAGFGNKEADYDQTDVEEMSLLMSGVWNAVQRRESTETLTYERNKYYQTLLSIGDGVMVIDHNRNIEFINPVASKLTGWLPEEAIGISYKRVFNLSHEQADMVVDDPIEKAFLTGAVQEFEDHAILTSKNGERFHLEDSAAPILDDKGSIAGVVLVFRDVSEKRQQRKKIEYMSFHDPLTSLYNRRFFEEELRRLDVEGNLPISILMGDVNSLKLTNDIFGHALGDLLLERVARSIQRTCRADDIIARWGGDEFILLLPKTNLQGAKKIAFRIKREVSKQQIRAIRSSISIGYSTKEEASEDILGTINDAEAKMYSVKILEHRDVQSCALNNIVNYLYECDERERHHALRVSEMCRRLGIALGLPESEIRRLKEIGRLHDIGKVVLEPRLLKKWPHLLSPMEQKEVEQHSVVGYRILNNFEVTLELAEAVLAHHENWDGSGYPKGLKDVKIPLLARAISIVEVYDRRLHPSIKDEAMSWEEALCEIEENAGTRFDPDIARVFIKMILDEKGKCNHKTEKDKS